MNQEMLLGKYDVPTPRYTSYPTVPFWDINEFNEFRYLLRLNNAFQATNSPHEGISLYIHLPYCESLCTYCGCNKRITTNHSVEIPYIETLLQEWKLYKNLLNEDIYIAELHLGGGTPTFFSAENLDYLLTQLLQGTRKAHRYDFSVEVHPNFLTNPQLEVFHKHGFKRISIGVQDVNIEVQKAIHRIQSSESTDSAIKNAKEFGFTSINLDLVYGLPKQTLSSMKQTIAEVLHWMPDRIALYSYAHVPWKSKAQRGYSEADLPEAKDKWEMFSYAYTQLLKKGYHRIGMDHFALPLDDLAVASETKKLHRNFMGYTARHTQVLIGLGVSSISDCGDGFVQNEKEIESYKNKVFGGKFPFEKGHLHTNSDSMIRKHILSLMCQQYTEWDFQSPEADLMEVALSKLQPFVVDGLVELTEKSIQVTPKGALFIRNICHCLDQSHHQKLSDHPVFSKAI